MLEINVDKKIIIRKANKNDDLERISELIYNVDPYIYPYWFGNLENCKKILPKLILEDNFIFNIETIYIAINSDNNEIVGLSSIVDKYSVSEYDYEKLSSNKDNIKYTIENYIKPMIENIKTKNIATITNMCVKKEYRNMHIGYRLLNTVIKEYVNNNDNDVEYDLSKLNLTNLDKYSLVVDNNKNIKFDKNKVKMPSKSILIYK